MIRARCNPFLLIALFCGCACLQAAGSGESRAYTAAESAFQLESWDYADRNFAEFTEEFPKSPRVPEAVLFQAKAKYQLNQFEDVIAILSTNRARAGMWQDDYLYWIAQAQSRLTNFQAAADAFAELSKGFPDSPRRLEAVLAEGAAFAAMGDWRRVAAFLQDPSDVFQQIAAEDPTNELIIEGYLLLGEAQLALKDFQGTHAAIEWLAKASLSPEALWRKKYLNCRLLLAEGQLQAALENTTNLLAQALAAASSQSGSNLPVPPESHQFHPDVSSATMLSQSVSFHGLVLERQRRINEAIAAYQANLASGVPLDQQRHALLKIAELYLAQSNAVAAMKALESYLDQHADSGAADMALLTLGELQLKQAASASGPATVASSNLIAQARVQFDRVLTGFPLSPLLGKALLDKGWCSWMQGQAQTNQQLLRESEELFRMAAERLPDSQDQAIARFKQADAQFVLKDFAGAFTNYQFVANHYASVPDLDPYLVESALYQVVRTALPLDPDAATQAMRRIMDSFPNSFAGPNALLLVGQALAQKGDCAGARDLFAEFESHNPTNALVPLVQLAVARSYEHEKNWEEAARQYGAWISRFTNQWDDLPKAEFYRAWDYSMAGRMTNALVLFTNLIGRFPTNELAQQAQWWIADYYFGQEKFHDAETYYQWIFKNPKWPVCQLTYEAQIRAGTSAMLSYGYKDACGYFADLASNSACPTDLRIQATLAAGDAFMARTDLDLTNRLTEAIAWYSTIPQSYPSNSLSAPALGQIGNCYLQLYDYERASNAFQRVTLSPLADVPARSQATVGLGLVAEGLAAKLKVEDDQRRTTLMKQALACYEDVLFQKMLRDGEQADAFWVKKAGQEAGRVAESLQQWQHAILIWQKLQEWLPQLRPSLNKKILNAQKNLREKASDRPFDTASRGG